MLERAARVLLSLDSRNEDTAHGTIHLLTEAFALADEEVTSALESVIERFQPEFAPCVRRTSLAELCGDAETADLARWLETYRMLQGTEADSSLRAWITASRPKFGPSTEAGFEFVRTLDRRRIGELSRRREHFARCLQAALGPNDLLCLPTAPTVAPLKSAVTFDRNSDYYRRALSLTSIAGVGRLPQISMPLATANGAPVGLSLIGARRRSVHVAGSTANSGRHRTLIGLAGSWSPRAAGEFLVLGGVAGEHLGLVAAARLEVQRSAPDSRRT